MTDENGARFDEVYLLGIALWYEMFGRTHEFADGVPEERAKKLRDAVEAHRDLRERCLLAELARDQALNALDRLRTNPTEASTTLVLNPPDRAA